MTPTLAALALATLGCGFGSHHERSRPVAECCDVCGTQTSEVMALIQTLQCHPRWRTRDNAAHDLRDYDWRCHPEILAALSTSIVCDREEEVREEAAESLAKIQPPPCAAEVHAALARVAQCDPDHATRKWARRGLERMAQRCTSPCDVCAVTPTDYAAAPPRTLLGRFFLPRNSAYIVPNSRVEMPPSVPDVIVEPYVQAVPAPYADGAVISPTPPEPGLIAPADPLDDLPPIEGVPAPTLPRSLNAEPRELPPAAIEASPFDSTPRAQRTPAGGAVTRVASVRPAASRMNSRSVPEADDDGPEREAPPRRRLFPFGLPGGRRGR